jgi:hypothetical protein
MQFRDVGATMQNTGKEFGIVQGSGLERLLAVVSRRDRLIDAVLLDMGAAAVRAGRSRHR